MLRCAVSGLCGHAPVHACAGVSGCVLNRFCAFLCEFGRFPFHGRRGGLLLYSTHPIFLLKNSLITHTQPTYFPKITPFETSGCNECVLNRLSSVKGEGCPKETLR